MPSASTTRPSRTSPAGSRSWTGIDHYDSEVTIGVVGKYVGLPDAYKSLREALVHGGIANRAKVNIQWIDAEMFEHPECRHRRRARAAARNPRPGRLRRARQRGQDRLGQVCSRAGNAILRNLPRHADGLHRRRPEHRRHRRGVDHRVRSDVGARRRPHHRMDERGRPSGACGGTATSAERCGSAPTRRSSTATASFAASTARTKSASAIATATR